MPRENPVAKLSPHRENLAEESLIDEHLQLAHAGEPELVLNHAVLKPRGPANPGEVNRLRRFHGRRLLAINRLPRLDGQLREPGALQCCAGVEEYAVERVGQGPL